MLSPAISEDVSVAFASVKLHKPIVSNILSCLPKDIVVISMVRLPRYAPRTKKRPCHANIQFLLRIETDRCAQRYHLAPSKNRVLAFDGF